MTEEIKELPKPTRRRRVGAFLVDHFFFTFLMVSGSFLIMGPNFIDQSNEMSSMFQDMAFVMIPGFILYFSKDFIDGISPGKWVAGIMVRTEVSHEIPTKGKLFIRNLFIMIWPIEFLVLAFSREKKRIGDNVAKTVVLNNSEKSKRLYRILALVGFFGAFYLFANLFTSAAIRSSEAYKAASVYIESNEELKKEVGDIVSYESTSNSGISITNGYGSAYIEISIEGTKSTGTFTLYLQKEPEGKWEIVEIRKYGDNMTYHSMVITARGECDGFNQHRKIFAFPHMV